MNPTRNPSDRYTKLNVRINDAERAMVQELQDSTGLTASQIVRRAVKAHHEHEIIGAPKCANGHDCMCPNLHYRMPRPAPPSPGARMVRSHDEA